MKTALLALGVLTALLLPGSVFGDEAFERALSLAEEKRFAEAREVLGPVLEDEPGYPRARLLHGVLRAHEGRVGEAIEIFEALRHEHPKMLEPYNNLAVLYALEGRLEAARETLLATLERQPDAVVYANLGDVYTKLAQRAYERARELEREAGGGTPLEAGPGLAIEVTPQGSSQAASGGGDLPESARQGREVAAGTGDAASESRAVAGQGQAAAVTAAGDVAAAGPVPAGAQGAMPSGFCAQAAGFEGRRAVADAALWLKSYGADVLEVRDAGRQVAGSRRVYLPPLESREAAEAKVREIRNRGVRDVAVIRDGELANGISFGVFRQAANTNRRVAALERLGYTVRSRATGVERAAGYAIKVRAGGVPATLDAAWTSRFPGRPLRVVDCG